MITTVNACFEVSSGCSRGPAGAAQHAAAPAGRSLLLRDMPRPARDVAGNPRGRR